MDAPPIDELTGLPTFTLLPDALRAPGADSVVAVFFDIDGFILFNDEHGHRVGDELLSRLGAWLADEARAAHGSAFRVAGDEFLLLLPGRTPDEAAEIAKRMMSSRPSAVTLSAVVFAADRELAMHLEATLDDFAGELYRAELASGRDHSNLVVRA